MKKICLKRAEINARTKLMYFPPLTIDSYDHSKLQQRGRQQLKTSINLILKQAGKCLSLTLNSAKPPITLISKAPPR